MRCHLLTGNVQLKSEVYIHTNIKTRYFYYFTPLFRGVQLVVVAVLSLQLPYASGEAKVESHVSSDTQPNQAALLLNTARIQLEASRTNVLTLVSAHCAWPATGVAGAR